MILKTSVHAGLEMLKGRCREAYNNKIMMIEGNDFDKAFEAAIMEYFGIKPVAELEVPGVPEHNVN